MFDAFLLGVVSTVTAILVGSLLAFGPLEIIDGE
jgi:hypothetical protein